MPSAVRVVFPLSVMRVYLGRGEGAQNAHVAVKEGELDVGFVAGLALVQPLLPKASRLADSVPLSIRAVVTP